jgi:xanthine dehydrogenase molybdopterin-binding subunit B
MAYASTDQDQVHNEGARMASSGKKKTTMAKLDRERRMRERRMDKAARKDARKRAAADPDSVPDTMLSGDETDESALLDAPQPELEAAAVARA